MISNKLTSIFGKDHVHFNSTEIDNYLQNVCASKRKILGVVYPQSEAEITQLIAVARELNIPLYPISTGYNYGLGSRLPVEDYHLIVDLSRMKRILSFDNELGVIRIEPGVTQQDIADYLCKMNANFILNVTGSSARSSVVGNALERGIGHFGSRVSEVISLEIVLGNGEKLTTDFANNFYPYGLGPDLKGLFFQSNFGIVTAMSLRLLAKTECIAVVSLEKKPQVELEEFITELRLAKQRQILPDNLHISNRARRLSVVTPLIARENNITLAEASEITNSKIQSDWAASASLRGEKKIVEAHIESLKAYIHHATLSVLWDSDLKKPLSPLLSALKGPIGHSFGIPSSDALLSLGYGCQQLLSGPIQESNVGTLFLVPIIPFRGSDFKKITDCINERFHAYGFEPYVTFNLVEKSNLEGVINLTFLKTDQQTIEAAYTCIADVFELMEQLGYPPLRLSIFQKSRYLAKNKKIRDQLKKMFDPNEIISRGRYEIY